MAIILHKANVPAFAMVGAAAFLSSVFRAPLTSALLLFELTRGYELVLPLLCAAGTGPLVYDALDRRLSAFTPAWQRRGEAKPLAAGEGEAGVAELCEVDNQMVCDEPRPRFLPRPKRSS